MDMQANVDNYAVTTGIVTESELPYTQQNTSPLWPLAAGWQNRVYRATSDNVTIAQGTNLGYVKACLENVWPADDPLQRAGGLVQSSQRQQRLKKETTRVVIVGYHDNVGSENAPGGGYWIVKNSWGFTGGTAMGYSPTGTARSPTPRI